MNSASGVIVIGGHVQGLGVARMIGMKNIPVIVMDYTKYNIARYSKYVNKFIQLTSKSDDAEGLTDELLALAKQYRLKNWLLFPTDDNTVAALSKQKEKLSTSYLVWTPKWDVIKLFYDKVNTYSFAEKIGISIPKSFFPANIEDLKEHGANLLYPVIIKPAVMQLFNRKTGVKAIVVNSLEELISQYKVVSTIIDPSEIIIQEIIPGSNRNLYSCGVFFKDSVIVESVIGRRARQIPMDFGKASTFVEIVDLPILKNISQKILSEAGYYGLAEVEFKYDERDGKYKLLEVNPRTWKWHTVSLLQGVNLPHMLYNDQNNISDQSNTDPRKDLTTHLIWVDEYTDIYISFTEILHGRMTFGQYIKSLSGKKMFGSFDVSDILPFIMETVLIPILAKR